MNENIPMLSTGDKLNPLAATLSGMPTGMSGVNAGISAMYPNAIQGLSINGGVNATMMPNVRPIVTPNMGLNYNNGGFNASINRSMGRYPMTQANVGYTRNF